MLLLHDIPKPPPAIHQVHSPPTTVETRVRVHDKNEPLNKRWLASGFIPATSANSGTLLFASDFDSSSLDGLTPQLPFTKFQWISDFALVLERITLGFPVLNYGISGKFVNDPAGSEHRVFRFELNRNDPFVYNSKRSELALQPVSLEGEYTYRFSVYLPSSFKADETPESIAQWHDKPDTELGEGFKIPALSFESYKGHLEIKTRWDPNALTVNDTPGKGGGIYNIDLGPYTTNEWIHFTVHVKWTCHQNGILEVYKNGILVMRHIGPTYYNDQTGPYMKFGIYKWDWKERPQLSHVDQRVLYMDNIREDEGNTLSNKDN